MCADTGNLKCSDWCSTAGLALFRNLDVNKDGVIYGFEERMMVKTLYTHDVLEEEWATIFFGAFGFAAEQLGAASPGTGCWGCDTAELYEL